MHIQHLVTLCQHFDVSARSDLDLEWHPLAAWLTWPQRQRRSTARVSQAPVSRGQVSAGRAVLR